MYTRITIVLVKSFRRVEGFKMKQSTTIKFCMRLKKTTTETFEMLTSAYGEEFLSRTNVFGCHKMPNSTSESENAKIRW
jgi:hypothetical protein